MQEMCRRQVIDPWIRRIPKEGHGNLLQYLAEVSYSSIYGKNPIDRGTLWAMVHGITKSRTQLKQLNRKTDISGRHYKR